MGLLVVLLGEVCAKEDTRRTDPGSDANDRSPQYTHVEHLPDDGTHVPHEHVLEAIHNRSYETHPVYEDAPDHGPYQLQVDLNVKRDTFSLDEHHKDVAEVGPNHVHFLSGAVHEHLTEGSVMLGSHEGLWLENLSSEDEGVPHLRPGAETGIVLSRRVTAINKHQDGSANVTTEAIHPFHSFEKIQYELNWTPTPKKRLKRRGNPQDGSDRRLELDMSMCGDETTHGHYLDPFNIELRKKDTNTCLEWKYDYDLFNFNYVKDCSLIVHVDRGEVHDSYSSTWWAYPDTYVKAWISGESEVTADQANTYDPEWDSELDMGCPSNVNATLNLQLIEDDGVSGEGASLGIFDDLMFTCAVTGWSEFRPSETQTCEGMSPNGLSHQIEFRVDYTPPNNKTKARTPSYDVGAMLAGSNENLEVNGITCDDCYARIGSDLTIQFGFTSTGDYSGFTNYFFVSASGEVDINVGLNAEDPSVAFLYVATFYEDSDYSDAMSFTPWIALQFKQKLEYQLEIVGTAQGTAGLNFSLNAHAGASAEYVRSSYSEIGKWSLAADADWGYSYNMKNELYNPTLDIRSTYRPTTYLQLSFLKLLHIRGTVSRSPYRGVHFYTDSTPQFAATVAEVSAASTFGVGELILLEVIYENAISGESMLAYIELVNDCESLKTFRIGEVLIEVASPTASLDFNWTIPWDSSLWNEEGSACVEQWRAQVHFAGSVSVVTTDFFGIAVYGNDEGAFSTPASGASVPTDTPYTLTWDTRLLKYFVNGRGTEPGYEMVSENVTLYLVNGRTAELFNMTHGPTENTGSLSVVFPSTLNTSDQNQWYMVVSSAEQSSVWSWSPGFFSLSSDSPSRRNLLSADDLNKDLGLKKVFLHAPVPGLPAMAVHEEERQPDRQESGAHRRLTSVCTSVYFGQDAQNTLDEVTLQILGVGPQYIIWENKGADISAITPATTLAELCLSGGVQSTTSSDAEAEEAVTRAPAPAPTHAPVTTRPPTTRSPTPAPTLAPVATRSPTPAPTPAPVVTRSPVAAPTLAPLSGGCNSNAGGTLGDGQCDTELNTESCGFDQGDCCVDSCEGDSGLCPSDDTNCVDPAYGQEPTPSPWPNCNFNGSPVSYLNDGYCDVGLNTQACGYDEGDCCVDSCVDSGWLTTCPSDDANCVDPTHKRTPAPTASPWPNCNFNGNHVSYLSDGYCDTGLNTDDCGYDEGDCCVDSCVDNYPGSCPRNDANCADPAYKQTPAPSALPWPNCNFGWSPISYLSDGYCDTGLNTEACGYDEGDCCVDSCVDNDSGSCPSNDANCADPAYKQTPAPSALPWPNCNFGSSPISYLSDGYCDTGLNTEACGYDEGDCCAATCVPQNGFACSAGDEHCVDPEHATLSLWEDCDFGNDGWLTGWHLNDTWCQTELNNELCGFDGGDCCAATCVERGLDTCDTQDDRFCVDPGHNAGMAWPNCNFGTDLHIWHLNDADCHTDLNNELCGFDGGDCCTATCEDKSWGFCSRSDFDCVDPDHFSALPWADCDFGPEGLWSSWNLNNSVCNTELNTPECRYDGGDCCISSCQDSEFNACSRSDFYCADPDHMPTPPPSSLNTPAPTTVFAWPDCDLGGSPASFVGDSNCDASLNTENCGYDGGDCCTATCVIKVASQDCTDGNAYCLDERYRYDCDFGDLSATDRRDGFCDQQLNTVVCDYDGGDCCLSTCVSGTYTCSELETDYPDCKDSSSGAFPDVPKLSGLLVTMFVVGLLVAQTLRGQ